MQKGIKANQSSSVEILMRGIIHPQIQLGALDIGLADHPLFFVRTLLILLGIQTFFIGLVAEIILFMHRPSVPYYNIEEKIA